MGGAQPIPSRYIDAAHGVYPEDWAGDIFNDGEAYGERF
jgi:hypothetical protein